MDGTVNVKNTGQKGGLLIEVANLYGGAFPKISWAGVWETYTIIYYTWIIWSVEDPVLEAHMGDFMVANDKYFLGFNMDTGLEGGVRVIDWNDADICGRIVHQEGTGRIYRITHENCKTVKNLNLYKHDDAKLVELLNHDNDWYVDHARRIL